MCGVVRGSCTIVVNHGGMFETKHDFDFHFTQNSDPKYQRCHVIFMVYIFFLGMVNSLPSYLIEDDTAQLCILKQSKVVSSSNT